VIYLSKNEMKKQIFILLSTLCIICIANQQLFSQKNYEEAFDLARIKINAREYRDAIPFLDKAIAFNPKIAQIHHLKGFCMSAQQKYEEAILAYNEAIKLDNKKYLYIKRRADAFYNSQQYEKSILDYKKAIEIEPTKKNDTLYQYLGDAYMKINEYADARDSFDKAILINPEVGQTYFDRAYMNGKLGNEEKACQDYQKAFDMGLYEAAKEAFEFLKCEWAMPREKNNSMVAISRVDVVPFTGAVFVSKGISYTSCEVVMHLDKSFPERNHFVANDGVFAKNEGIIIRIYNPKGVVMSLGQSSVGVSCDIYEGSEKIEGIGNDMVGEIYGFNKLADMTVGFFFIETLKINKNYILKAKIYDKLFNNEVSIEMPFVLAKNVERSYSNKIIQSTVNENLQTFTLTEIVIKKITFAKVGKLPNYIKKNQKNTLLLSEIQGFSDEVMVRHSFVKKDNGVREFYTYGIKFLTLKDINIPLKIPKEAGNYVLWVEVKDKKNTAKIWTMTYTVVVE
jgi:Tfp pilus assembly protein PilF